MSSHLKGIVLALAGIVILSPDTLLVRLLDMEQWPLQFYRGAGTFLALLAGMSVIYRGRTPGLFLAVGRVGLATACCYAVSTLLFVSALYHTSVANTLAIISTAPVFGALLSRLALKERLPLRTWIAVLLAVSAISIIVAGDLGTGSEHLFGDALALSQSLFMAASFVLVRSRPEVNMVPCMALSGLIVALVALAPASRLAVSPDQLPLLLILSLFVLPVSFALLFLAPRHIPAPEVNMIMLLEMILGPLLVWLVMGESVAGTTIVGGGLLFTVVLVHSLLNLRRGRFLARPLFRRPR